MGVGYAADKMEVIPNGFDLSHFRLHYDVRLKLSADLGSANDTLLAGMIGRFESLKNHSGFIQQWRPYISMCRS